MKPLKFSVLFIFSMFLITCSSDDDTSSNSNFDLEGTWSGVAVRYDTSSIVNFQGQSFTTTCEGEGFDLDFQITFSSNPNEYSSTGTFSVALTCMALGQSFEETEEDLDFLGNGLWNFDGDDLVLLEDNEEEIIVEIVELSSGNIQMLVEETEIFEDDSISTVNTISISINLERI